MGKLSLEFCKYSLYKTVLGLMHVHSENAIWRDLKSDNICVTSNGDFKFLDFDYSCLKNEEEQTFTEKAGTVCWMAPEIFRNVPYDEKVDIYSLSMFAIELAEGDPPNIDEPPQRVIFRAVKDEKVPRISAKWPVEFQDFIDCAGDKNPKTRWSAEQLLAHPFLQGADRLLDEWKAEWKKWDDIIKRNKSYDHF